MLQSTKILCITVLISIFLATATETVFCQNQEYKEYTILKGDTLWDISSKEIADPFLWPKIWKENPDIKNPDLIYPGQRIRIPLLQIQKEQAPLQPVAEKEEPIVMRPEVVPLPEVKKETPPIKIKPREIEPLVDKNMLMSSGYIADSIEGRGLISGSPTNRTVLGKDDFAYIETAAATKAGDRFYVIRSLGKVHHPETGALVGYLIDVVGIAEVIEKDKEKDKAVLAASFSEVFVGDILTDFQEITPLYFIDRPRTPNISGFIIAAKQKRILNARSDIVFIDKGSKDGLEVGDVLRIVSNDKNETPHGLLQVIRLKEKTATAMIQKSDKEVTAGDRTVPLIITR